MLSDISQEVQRRFAEFDDPAHGWEHVRRVYALALRKRWLARQQG